MSTRQSEWSKVLLLMGTFFGALLNISAGTSFTGLGDLPGSSFHSSAADVSGDGSVVVGFSYSLNGQEAFRWTSGNGMVGLGDFPAGSFISRAEATSADGSTIVGDGSSSNGSEAFTWTTGGGMGNLGSLPGGFYSFAHGVSSNGSAVVGYGNSSSGTEAFRWTVGSGMVGLGDFVGGNFDSLAEAVSDDGSVVVGYGSTADGWEAFRWTFSGGMVGLGTLPGGTFSRAWGVSSDGSVVVGHGNSSNGLEAFFWNQSNGMQGLGDLVGGSFWSVAEDVSSDGSVIVGYSYSDSGKEAFVWDESNGMRSLKSVLEGSGVDVTGWTLSTAEGISDDGSVIVGSGTNPDGNPEAFRAVIPMISPPAPPGEIGVSTIAGSILDSGNATFGNQAVGIGKVQTFTVSNEATGEPTSLSDFSISKSGKDASAFAVGAISAGSLGNGQFTSFRVTFTPTSATAHSAAIHISSNDEDESPFDINLSGLGLANSDSEPGSDAWETANGFSPSISDYYTRDSDGDGIPDIREMYFGWPRYPSFPFQTLATDSVANESSEGDDFFNVHTSSNGVFKVQYRRSTTQTALIANPIWTSSLSSNGWKYSGESSSGTVVTVTDNVVSNGVDFEIVESSAEVTSGDTDSLFFTLELLPNE